MKELISSSSYNSLLFWSSTLLLATTVFLILNRIKPTKPNQTKSKKKLIRPPGPSGWPIIGNILELGTMPHQSLYSLREKYGGVVWLKLGSLNFLAVQSAKATEILYKNHDLAFCDRLSPDCLQAHNYYQGSMAFGRYGSYWRTLRRLFTSELMTNKRMEDTVKLRRRCVDSLLKNIEQDTAAKIAKGKEDSEGVIVLADHLFHMSFNMVGNIVLSRDLLSNEDDDDNKSNIEGKEFYNAMDNIIKWMGIPNVSDFLPFLKRLDPQGLRRNMEKDMGKAMKILTGFVKERVEDRKLGRKLKGRTSDFLDVLLDNEGAEISYTKINVFLVEMFLAGTETSSSAIEWGVVELLRSPESMKKVKEELDRVIGPERKLEESDIDNLPYLNAVIKETMRLHPPTPLIQSNAVEDTEFMGYDIPKGTQIMLNTWSLGRDYEAWDDHLAFKPERFLGSNNNNVDYKGQSFGLLPFGSGRRICAGMPLAHRLLHLVLGSLLHNFDWKLPKNTPPETIDMNDRFGVTLRKLVHLEAIPTKRLF